MSTLVEAFTVVVPRHVLDAGYPGGTDGYLHHARGRAGVRYAIGDARLACVSFASPAEVDAFTAPLLALAITGEDGTPLPLACVDEDFGPTAPCPWLRWRRHDDGFTSCWLEWTEPGDLVTPDGWVPPRQRGLRPLPPLTSSTESAAVSPAPSITPPAGVAVEMDDIAEQALTASAHEDAEVTYADDATARIDAPLDEPDQQELDDALAAVPGVDASEPPDWSPGEFEPDATGHDAASLGDDGEWWGGSPITAQLPTPTALRSLPTPIGPLTPIASPIIPAMALSESPRAVEEAEPAGADEDDDVTEPVMPSALEQEIDESVPAEHETELAVPEFTVEDAVAAMSDASPFHDDELAGDHEEDHAPVAPPTPLTEADVEALFDEPAREVAVAFVRDIATSRTPAAPSDPITADTAPLHHDEDASPMTAISAPADSALSTSAYLAAPLQAMRAQLGERGWRCSEEPDGRALFYHVSGGRAAYPGRASYDADAQLLAVHTHFPVRVPEHRRQAAVELLTRVNHALPNGNFDFGFDDGEVRFRIVADTADGCFSAEAAGRMVEQSLGACDRYHDALMQLIYGGLSPAEALDSK